MSLKNWFILSEGQVIGPFSPEEVESKLGSFRSPQVWGRGQAEWMEPAKWRQVVREMPAPKDTASSLLWKIRVEGKDQPPMSYNDMLKYLRKLKDYSTVDVYMDNSKQWKELYAVQQVVDELGISRRSHPRVPITGTLDCEKEDATTFTCRIISISEGGLGVSEAKNLQIGQRFKSTLASPNLYMTISCSCEVVYVGNDGYAGLRFVALTDEAKSSIIEYIKKFAT